MQSPGLKSVAAAVAPVPAAGNKRKRGMSLTGGLSLDDLPAEARRMLVEQLQHGVKGGKAITDADLQAILAGEGSADEMDEGSDGSDDEEEEEGSSEGSSGDDDDEEEEEKEKGQEGAEYLDLSKSKKARKEEGSAETAVPPGGIHSPAAAAAAADSALKPYPAEGQLEFLDDCFQMIALMIKGNVARMKDDMKKEGATSRYNSYEGSGELKHSRRELAAKLRLQESRIQIRLKKTEEAGHPLPRLEVMNQRFRLDPFEKKIILLLIGAFVDSAVLFCSINDIFHFMIV